MQITQINPCSPNYLQQKQATRPSFRSIKVLTNDRLTMTDILEKLCRHSFVSDIFPKLMTYLNESKTITAADIKRVCGRGGLSIVFDLGEKGVLKCSLENPLEYRKHNPKLDIPFLSEVKQIDDLFFIHEAKADCRNVTREDLKAVLENIKKCGLEPSSDADRIAQVGIYEGKPYLLDTRCARPKPNLFSRFVRSFCNNYRRYIIVQSISDTEKEAMQKYNKLGPKALHVDESPRNIPFVKGCKMILEVIKQNLECLIK